MKIKIVFIVYGLNWHWTEYSFIFIKLSYKQPRRWGKQKLTKTKSNEIWAKILPKKKKKNNQQKVTTSVTWIDLRKKEWSLKKCPKQLKIRGERDRKWNETDSKTNEKSICFEKTFLNPTNVWLCGASVYLYGTNTQSPYHRRYTKTTFLFC